MKFKKIIIAVASMSILLTACSTTTKSNSTPQNTDAITVVTSINPVDKLVRYIGGTKINTVQFVKPGIEPHDFEPSPKDMEKLNNSKALFLNGLDMEHWSEKLTLPSGIKKIELSEKIDPIKTSNVEDPHIWLGLNELKIMAENTFNALSEISPDNKVYFKENLDKFNKEADTLAAKYKPEFDKYKGKSFVTGHEAFAYLCRNIGMVQMAVEGPFGGGEPTPQKITELVDYVKAHGITTVFTEEAAPPKVSATLAKETNAKLVTIPTMESDGEIFDTIETIYKEVLESLK